MDKGFKLVVGLGNPGERYQKTRHNAGFWFIDELACQLNSGFRDEPRFHGAVGRLDWRGCPVFLLKPATFMNRSGQAVAALASYFKIKPAEILIAHDDLDLAPGVARIKFGGGHGGHNGLRDVMSHLNSADFFRLRFGVGHPGDRAAVVNFVLEAPSGPELALIREAIVRVLRFTSNLFDGSVTEVTNTLNTTRASSVTEKR